MIQHIVDEMGVAMTLIAGERSALLVDTGYGLTDTAARIRALISLPIQVLLTHGHHDHALGAMWFEQVLLHPDDLPVYREYTSERWRRHVLAGARERGIQADTDLFLAKPVAEPVPFAGGEIDLGGLKAQVLSCPGHTPGSLAVYVPQERLLLTGDDWNPTTWCFFPEALSAEALLDSLRSLLRLPFERVLCPHQPEMYPRSKLEAFVAGMTPELLDAAAPSQAGDNLGIPTRAAILADGQTFVFDPTRRRKP